MGPRLGYVVSDQGVNLRPFIARLQPRSLRGQKELTMWLSTTYKSWDDPPSTQKTRSFGGWNFSRNPGDSQPRNPFETAMDFPAGFQEFGGLEKVMSKKNLTRKIPPKKELGSKKKRFSCCNIP